MPVEVSEREYRRAESLVGFEENDTEQRSRALASTTRGDASHSTHPKVNAAKASKKVRQTSSGTKKAMKSSREAKFRNYLNTDGTLDKLTRALDDLLRSNVKPDSPSDWLVARLSDDYSNKLKEAQEDLEEQVKENEKLKERLEKSRRFVKRLQEDVEDLTKKLEEEKEMAEAIAAKAMHEPQEVAMLKEELKEVMEDANEMADLIREYEQREEERLAMRSARKELREEGEVMYGDGNVPSSPSSDVSSKKLMRFEQIQEKVRRQHEEEQKYKQPVNRSGGTSPTASEVSSQCMEDDNANPYFNRHTMPPSRRITESEGKMLF